jgi:hypothetical protein
VKEINEDGACITKKVMVKQLRYIPVTSRLKRLFLCEETVQQMRWHKDGIHDSEDADIMLHPVDAKAWYVLPHETNRNRRPLFKTIETGPRTLRFCRDQRQSGAPSGYDEVLLL